MRKIEIDEYDLFYSVRIMGKDEFVVHFRKDGSLKECIAIRYGEYGFYKPEEFKETFPVELQLAKAYFDTFIETKSVEMQRQYKD